MESKEIERHIDRFILLKEHISMAMFTSLLSELAKSYNISFQEVVELTSSREECIDFEASTIIFGIVYKEDK